MRPGPRSEKPGLPTLPRAAVRRPRPGTAGGVKSAGTAARCRLPPSAHLPIVNIMTSAEWHSPLKRRGLMVCLAAAVLWTGSLWAQPLTWAEAHALREEFLQRYQRLDGLVQDLIEGQAALNRRLDALAAEVRQLRQAAGAVPRDLVTQDQLQAAIEALRKAIQEQQDRQAREVTAELERLRKLLEKTTTPPAPRPQEPIPTEGFEYTIQPGDTLSAIVKAYREAGVKGLTVDLVLRANKGLKPERLIPGQKIFIPDPRKR